MFVTYDNFTVYWVRERVSFWLSHELPARAGSGRRLSRWFRHRSKLPLLAALAALSGCVPATQFEEAESAARVEMEGRRRAEARAQELDQELAAARNELASREEKLSEREEALAQAEFDSGNLGKQREDAEGLVEQLRGELSRVGDHLRNYASEKQRLEASLAATDAERARERAEVEERSRWLMRAARDMTLAFPERIARGEYGLDAEPGKVVLRVPRQELVTPSGEIAPTAETTLAAWARIATQHRGLTVELRDVASPSAKSLLQSELERRGVPRERFAVEASPEPASDPSSAPEPAAPALASGGAVTPAAAATAGAAEAQPTVVFALVSPS